TPAAAVYMASVGAAGLIVLTASHNPSNQNGIKIFLGPAAMKPLPEDDDALSARVWETAWSEVAGAPDSGECTDTASESRVVYSDYIRALPNCWLQEGALSEWDIVLDTARGAWSGLATEIFEELSTRSLVEASRLGDGPVNEGGGVVALEGRVAIGGGEVAFIEGHAGLCRLFEAGRARAEDLKAGAGFAVCGIFDADGDRAYTAVYDPFEDRALVLGGDEAMVLQAGFLKAVEEVPEDGVAALTIESDSGAAMALSEFGLGVRFTPVGDKWLLRATTQGEGTFTLGGEESGHSIVPGRLSDAFGNSRLLAVGDGLKSFLNTCAAIGSLAEDMDIRAFYQTLAEPFPRGYKKTLYAYHVDRRRFEPGGEAWEAARAALETGAKDLPHGTSTRWAPLEDDPSVLYLAVDDSEGRPAAAIYVRNSGTERKIGVVLRGPVAWRAALYTVGQAVLNSLLPRMKDEADPNARAEAALLLRLSEGALDAKAVDEMLERDPVVDYGAPVSSAGVRREALRGGLISEDGGMLCLAELGRWYLDETSAR
ncbi:MAG: hypothetical protein HN400_12500, partial [Nitrospinaceae bacterium]|nr:hypothetical protein [Nitrospinaceae bacterium]